MRDLLLILLGLVLLGPFLTIATKSILNRFWTIMFINECAGRAKIFWRFAWLTILVCGILGLSTFGTARFAAVTFFTLAITPWATVLLTNLWAWRHDDAAQREAAVTIATELAVRSNERPPSIAQRWPRADYIFDVEFARRRAIYEPPPI